MNATFASYTGQSGGTPKPEFVQNRGTVTPTQAGAVSPQKAEPTGLIEWLASEEARRLTGRWVLLTDDFQVIDSRETPRELLDDHPEERTPFIVYVDPHDRS